jgi:hypothetical protein
LRNSGKEILVPLAFQSINRGTIAFGFFNIDTDLLLFQQYFFFADDSCARVVRLAEDKAQGTHETAWEAYSIEDATKIGDLMAAIHGIRHTGFIGEVYKRFPFPRREAEFKQKPEGFQNRAWMVALLGKWAGVKRIPVRPNREHETVSFGEYLFTKEVFHQLIQYVWVGGYPRWKDEIRPDYVMEVKFHLEESRGWLTRGLVFS